SRSRMVAVKSRKIPTDARGMRRFQRPSSTHRLIPQFQEPTMIDVQGIDQLAQRLAALVPPGLNAAREDLQANFRDVLAHGLRRFDLVTREEFDAQRAVLSRTRELVAQLEARVAELEAQRAK